MSGHSRQCLRIEVDDALAIAEQVEV